MFRKTLDYAEAGDNVGCLLRGGLLDFFQHRIALFQQRCNHIPTSPLGQQGMRGSEPFYIKGQGRVDNLGDDED